MSLLRLRRHGKMAMQAPGAAKHGIQSEKTMSFKVFGKVGKLTGSKSILAAGALLALTLSLGSGMPVLADNMVPTLSKLEYKYFQHDYEKDDPQTRLERLEKMVFGEARTGSDEERLKNLVALVPDLDSKVGGSGAEAGEATPVAQSPRQQPERVTKQPSRTPRYEPVEEAEPERTPGANDSSYPAITAVEKKLLGRDYIGESVGKRLDRLEIKAFGKTSASADLQDRLDRLKSTSGVDVARQAPPNSDWSDEDDGPDLTYLPDKGIQPYTGIGEDGRSFSGRDLRKDFAQAMGNRRPAPSYRDDYAGTGTFGAGGGRAPAAAPSRGNDRFEDDMPPMAPSIGRSTGAPATAPSVTGMGLSQQVALLEREVFQKTYAGETIPARLNRLESTVFPREKPSMDKALPERMTRLLAAVPISQAAVPQQQAKRPKPQRDPDFGDLGDDDGGMPPMAPQRQAGNGGLSKIINGLGSMLTGGMVGGYGGAAPGTLVTDPQTGFLYDQYTGTLIDPMTGAVVGRRSVQYGGAPAAGTGFGGFNSGFSPMSPYGMQSSGMRFGFGSGGVGLGWP